MDARFDGSCSNQWRQYVISQTKELGKWSLDTLHCVMCCVLAITNQSRRDLLSDYDEGYCLSLISIMTDARFHRALLPTLINDESLLVHCAVEYFLQAVAKHQQLTRILFAARNKLKRLASMCEVSMDATESPSLDCS